MRFSTALAALLFLSSCELPMTTEFNSPLDAKAPAGNSTKILREFGFAPGPGSGTNPAGPVVGVINEAAGTVAVTVPSGTDLASLVATFSYSGASIKVGGEPQTSGTSKNSFVSAVVYTITATDGSAKNYTVTVSLGNTTGGTPAPIGVSATPGNQQVSIAWGPVTGAINYNVYWSTTPGVTVQNGTKAPGVASPYIHTPLTNGVTYYFIVTAVSPSGESPASTQVSATPVAPGSLPSTPTAVSATPGNGQNSVGWATVTGANTYNLYWSTTPGVTVNNGNKIASLTGPPFLHNGLNNGTTYYYVVTAFNTSGESPASVQVSAAPALPGTPPTSPTGVTVTAGDTQNTLNWSPVSGASSYTVYWATSSGVSVATGTKVPGLVGETFNHPSLVNGTTYYYLVTASNASGESPASILVSAKPVAPLSSAKDITSFTFPSSTNTVISASGGTTGTIDVTVPAGTNVTSLVPTLSHSGDSISPISTTARNFSSPQTYTVTAANGTTKVYTVTVTVAAAVSGPKITLFKFPAFADATVITETGASTGTIAVTVPFGTNLNGLTPSIGHDGVNVNPASGSAADFTTPKNYLVTSLVGALRTYTVTVTAAPKPAITSFTIGGVGGVIGTNTIRVDLAAGATVNSLVPSFTTTAGAIVKVGTAVQTSGASSQNFSSAVTYTVTDLFGTPTTTYSVNVTRPADVTVTLPQVFTPTLSETSWTMSSASTKVITMTAALGGATVEGWYLDGTKVTPSNTTTSFTVNLTPNVVTAGPHSLMVVVLSNGTWYSATAYFTVN